MIEAIILKRLNAELERVTAYTEKPEPVPNRFVRIEKTGSTTENYIETAVMAVQSYAETLLEAAKLNKKVKRAMQKLLTEDSIASVHLITDYNFTDVETKRHRYQAVYNVTYYGEE